MMPGTTLDPRRGAELARFIDALGRVVTATVAPSGLLIVLTRTPATGLRGGHPALDRETARVLGTALIEFADREGT
jgi:hypothetical protein